MRILAMLGVIQAACVGTIVVTEMTGITDIFSDRSTTVICPTGKKGEQGATGPAGQSGSPGAPGAPGSSGAPGAPGAQGATGETGARGKTGPAGATGATGAPGASGTPGPSGAPGSTGLPGSSGVPGASGVAGSSGPPGSSGAPGITGQTGTPGPSGAPGSTGAAGPAGPIGQTGPAGAAGVCTAYYGSYYDTTTQTVGAGVTAAMTLDTVAAESGVSLESGTRLRVSHSAVYNVQFSTQLILTGNNTADQVEIWLAKNGAAVPDSNTSVYLDKSNARYVAAWNFMVPLTANDYVELMWYSSTGRVQILYVAPTGGRPAIPSLILTVNQVGEQP